MDKDVRLKEPKPLVRAAGSPDPVKREEDERENESDGVVDNFGESEIERARRLPLSPIRPRSEITGGRTR
jgi:hypothetical protein